MENTLKMMSLQGRPQSFIFGRQLQIIFANDGSDVTLHADTLAALYTHVSSFSGQC